MSNFKEKKRKCRLIENALKDPTWDDSLNAELCMGDCDNCPHSFIEKDRLEETINAICDRLEEKRLRQAKLEFVSYVMNIALEKTNQKLEENNLLNFMKLLQEKDHYQEEFKKAIFLFEKNFHEQMEKITNEVIQAIKEE